MGRLFYATLLAIGVSLMFGALSVFMAEQQEYASARDEYAQLREAFAGSVEDVVGLKPGGVSVIETVHAMSVDEVSKTAAERLRLSVLTEINSDFVGWLTIDGTTVDYPVVRGRDNEIYLDTLFTGWRNQSGAVFMDYRCEKGFNSPVSILYGHNMQDGSMFAPLSRYLDPVFLADHPEITITTPEGETLSYQVFEVKLTDAWDPAYSVGFPEDEAPVTYTGTSGEAKRILILSTCVKSAGKDARLLVYSET